MPEIVHCPKCHSAVSVQAGQAGQRVQCPSCLKQFLAPASLSGAGSSAEDEDWLSLADPDTASPATPQRPVAADQPTSTAADASPSDEDPFLDDDDEGLDVELIDETDADSAGFGASGFGDSDPDDLFAGLPSLDSMMPASGQSSGAESGAGSQPAAARELGDEDTFRVKCSICGSVLYAKAKQAGKTIKCSDCYSEIRVPPPPKKAAPPKPQAQSAMFDLAETSGPGRPADPFQKNAQELMKAAEAEPDKEYKPKTDVPSTIGWFKSVFGIFLDTGVIIHFVGVSLLLAIPAALTFAFPVFAIGAIPLAMIGIAVSVACGFAILFGVANQHERIEDWPTVDPTGWMESMWLVITATAIAVGPAYVITKLFGAPPVVAIGFVMFSVYVAFPIILLSMLDEQSVTSPFSTDVGKSITQCQDDWGAFYFSSGMLFAALFAYFLTCSYSPASVAIGVVLSVAVVFMYFAMLGRLALAMGEVIEFSALERDEDDQEQAS
ncbi:hypothetical protein NHH03_00985 [Stieleria sp. TO1_6]|uniref:hypothetical protein n=1 Tax=Stieleria tagensis TaxID=2956795 RepID=UPI00209B0757|nr:hypothetical protein [Stieleria tagensis]MCO8120291.1 hypothetical protein [Stieleria tagensis]